MKVDIKKLEGSEVELSGEIPAVDFESCRNEVMNEFRLEVEVAGFRKGHAPDNMIIEKVGAEKILYEMAEHTLAHYYPEMVKENNIDAIGRPEIAITKIAEGSPLGFKIKTAVMPEIKLPDYKKIAKAENAKPEEDATPTEEEVAKVIEEIRKSRAPKHEHKEGEVHDDNEPAPELPELNDEFAKSLGQFESVADLKAKIKENLGHEKSHHNIEKKRLAIMEEVIKGTKTEVPKILIDGELRKMSSEMRGQLENMGLKFEDYLTHIKKTEADLETDWKPEAEKRVKFGLVLETIAKEETIKADPAELEHEIEHILENYKDADRDRVTSYAENMLVNEAVFKFLENC